MASFCFSPPLSVSDQSLTLSQLPKRYTFSVTLFHLESSAAPPVLGHNVCQLRVFHVTHQLVVADFQLAGAVGVHDLMKRFGEMNRFLVLFSATAGGGA